MPSRANPPEFGGELVGEADAGYAADFGRLKSRRVVNVGAASVRRIRRKPTRLFVVILRAVRRAEAAPTFVLPRFFSATQTEPCPEREATRDLEECGQQIDSPKTPSSESSFPTRTEISPRNWSELKPL